MPRKPESDVARTMVGTRLHPGWVERLDERCKRAGCARAEYLRRAVIFSVKYMPNDWKGERMWWETGSIGHGDSGYRAEEFIDAP